MCQNHENRPPLRPGKRVDILPFLCFDCGKTVGQLYYSGSCRACLRDADKCLECGADTDGGTYCPSHEPEPEAEEGHAMGSGPDGRTTCQSWKGGAV